MRAPARYAFGAGRSYDRARPAAHERRLDAHDRDGDEADTERHPAQECERPDAGGLAEQAGQNDVVFATEEALTELFARAV